MYSKATTIIFLILAINLLLSCSESPTGTELQEEQTEESEQAITTGTLEITTATSGNSTDEDGYNVDIGDASQPIGTDDTVTFTDLEEGTYDVKLNGLSSICTITGENPVAADVTAEKTTTVNFEITCEETTAEGIIAFSSRVDGVFEIFTIQADGSDLRQLTSAGEESSHVDISPDGTKLVFSRRNPTTTKFDIWVMDIDGGNPTQLTSEGTEDRHPSWSPDGSQIVFETERDGNFNIYVMNADGTNKTQLTTAETQDIQPDWAPGGDKIAFISDDDQDGISDIFVINADGTNRALLVEATVDNGINIFDPAWSADGSQIAYQGYSTTGNAKIFIADADGTGAQAITDSEVFAMQPAWSPDGTYLAFTNLASAGTTDAIWIAKTDGTGAVKLTDDQGTYSAFSSWGINPE